MRCEPIATYFGAPSTTRAQAMPLTFDQARRWVGYPSGLAAVVRAVDGADGVVCGRHAAAVTVVAVSPSGRWVLSGDREGHVIVWANRPDTAESLATRPIVGPIRDAAWSGDDERAVVVGDARGAYGAVFAVKGGNNIGSITGHSSPAVSCDFRQERPYRIATGGLDASVAFLEGPPFKFVRSNKDHKNTVHGVKFSPNGMMIATVSSSDEVVLLDGKTGERERSISTGHQGTIYSVAWSEDSTFIATGSADKTVRVFNALDGSSVFVKSWVYPNPLLGMVQGVAFARGQVWAVSLNSDIMQLSMGGEIQGMLRGHSKIVVGMGLAGGSLITSGSDGKTLLWKNHNSTEIYNIYVDLSCACISGNFVWVVTSGAILKADSPTSVPTRIDLDTVGVIGIGALEDGLVAILAKSSLRIVGPQGVIHNETLANFGGQSLAVCGNAILIGGENSWRCYEWTSSLKLRHTAASPSAVTAVALHAKGLLALGEAGRHVHVLSLANFAVVRGDMLRHNNRVTALSFSPDGTYIVSGGLDSSMVIWSIAEQTQKVVDGVHRGGVLHVTFGEGGCIYSAGNDCCIRVWKFSYS